jgi:hypothetical protein
MGPYSIYDYLTFILPGGIVLFAAAYGWFGWPWHEPGASALVGLLAAAFIVGNALAAIGTWIEPLLLGASPGSTPDGLWGQFADGDRFEGRRAEITSVFESRYGEADLTKSYRLAQAELRTSGKADDLSRISSQIGFYRGMAVASAICFLIELVYVCVWKSHLPTALWLSIFALLVVLSVYRFRRFWRWFGDYVLRTILALERVTPSGPKDRTDEG